MRIIKNKKNGQKITKSTKDSFYCAKEDIAEIMLVAEKFAGQVNKIETKVIERMQKFEIEIFKLQKEINELKNRS